MEDREIYEIMKKGKVNDFGKAENVWFTSDTHFGHAKIIEDIHNMMPQLMEEGIIEIKEVELISE